MCSFACVAPAPFLEQPAHQEEVAPLNPLEDPAARSERSTNLSFVAGTARRIQMFIKNRHLQILPDGTVNGTTDDTSVFSKFLRHSVPSLQKLSTQFHQALRNSYRLIDENYTEISSFTFCNSIFIFTSKNLQMFEQDIQYPTYNILSTFIY